MHLGTRHPVCCLEKEFVFYFYFMILFLSQNFILCIGFLILFKNLRFVGLTISYKQVKKKKNRILADSFDELSHIISDNNRHVLARPFRGRDFLFVFPHL